MSVRQRCNLAWVPSLDGSGDQPGTIIKGGKPEILAVHGEVKARLAQLGLLQSSEPHSESGALYMDIKGTAILHKVVCLSCSQEPVA